MLLNADAGWAGWAQPCAPWPTPPREVVDFRPDVQASPSPAAEPGEFGPFPIECRLDGAPVEEDGDQPSTSWPDAPDDPGHEVFSVNYPPPPPSPFVARPFLVRESRSGLFLEDDAGNTWTSAQGPSSSLFFGSGPALDPEALPSPPEAGPSELPPEAPYGPPSPEELATTARVPWTRDHTVIGTIAAGEPSAAFRIPVGPATNLIKLALRPEEGPDGWAFGVKLDQVFLMGPDGAILAAIAGVSSVSDGVGQTLHVSIHGAPRGGELVVRVIQTRDLSPIDAGGDLDAPGASDESPTEPWSSAPFEVHVQRSDASPKDPEARAFASVGTIGVGPSYIIYLPPATHERAPLPSSAAGGASFGDDDAGGAASGGPVADGPRTEEAASDDLEIAEKEAAPSVFLGPLVSRTAAPLGPALATSTDDPTPSTTRGRRPGPDAPDVLGDHDLGLYLGFASSRARRAAADMADADADRAGGGGDALVSLRGAGGVPMLVGGLGRNDARKEAEALAENLQRQAEAAELVAEAVESDSPLDPDPRDTEIARAGLATRAVVFLIGLGLATSPLYPDLVAFARKKLMRKSRRARRRKIGL